MTKEMTGAEMVIEALADQGVQHIFGYPGGAVLPIYDAIFQQQKVQHILVRHEQGAVHAAEGYARSTGKVGCVLVTSGPGATNAVTGLTDALCDSIPIVVITGQVPTHLIGNDAFQECDTVGITRPCTKHNYLVKRIEDLPRVLHEAFHIASSGRPGPVVVDIPKDIQFAKGTYSKPTTFQHQGYKPRLKGDPNRIKQAVELMARAKRPLFYTGGGVINSGPRASALLRELVKLTGFPITSTLMGLGAYPGRRSAVARHARHARHLGGELGDARLRRDDLHRRALRRPHHRAARRVLAGLDQDPRRHRPVVDQQERQGRRADHRRLRPCARGHARGCGARAKRSPTRRRSATGGSRSTNGGRGSRSPTRTPTTIIKPQYAIQRLYELTKDRDTYITTEVGQHQMWAAQFYGFQEPNRWMTSGGLGTMGYGLPAAIGVQLAHPQSLVIDIAGEASVLMNMQEMSTAVQYRLPIKVFILNNQYMGMVRQWQELLHGGRYAESYTHSLPDFVKLAEAYHAVGIRCERPGDLDGAIKEMIDGRQAGAVRLRGRSERELLPDDPVRPRPQRDDPGRQRRERRRSDHRRRQGDGVIFDLILRSAQRARLEGWLRVRLRPSFETHRFAMLLRMRINLLPS